VVKADAANRAWLQEVTKKSIAALKEAGVLVTSPNETQRAEFAAMAKPVYQEVVAADVLELFLSVSEKYR
jgi:TRAP-type C4-dicarboxylate transport system substrate-binding protein